MYEQNPYESPYNGAVAQTAAWAEEWERSAFIRRTYLHLCAAIMSFAAIEAIVFTQIPDATLGPLVMSMFGGWNFLILIGAFIVTSYVADYWARTQANIGMQYAGLVLYVVAEAVIFIPLLYLAQKMAPGAIGTAGLLTLVVFGGLTAMVFLTKADFATAAMARFLGLAAILALGTVLAAIIFQFSLGVWFSAAMVGLAAGYILYDTSNIVHHYRTDQHVAASLALFSSVALMFWYILRLVMSFSDGGE